MPVALKVICQLRNSCRTCRDLVGGRRWRASLYEHLAVPPPEGVDWQCPEGFTFDTAPEHLPSPLTPEQQQERAVQAAERNEAARRAAAERWRQQGPKTWAEIHTKENPTARWFTTLITLLPCGDCRNHAIIYLRDHPPDYGAGWFRWTYDFHRAVNERLGKPDFTFDEAIAKWPQSSIA